MTVQELLKSVKTCQSYWQKFTATFLMGGIQGGQRGAHADQSPK